MEFSSLDVSGFEPITILPAQQLSQQLLIPPSSAPTDTSNTDAKTSKLNAYTPMLRVRRISDEYKTVLKTKAYKYPKKVSEIKISSGQIKTLSGKSHPFYSRRDVQISITNKTSFEIRVEMMSDGFFHIYYPDGSQTMVLHGNPKYKGIKLIPSQKTYTEEYVE